MGGPYGGGRAVKRTLVVALVPVVALGGSACPHRESMPSVPLGGDGSSGHTEGRVPDGAAQTFRSGPSLRSSNPGG